MDSNEFFAPARTPSDDTAAPADDAALVSSGDAVDGEVNSAGSVAKPPKVERTPVWIDLLNPSDDEIHEIEKRFAIEVPTREEMQEIELSSRLYDEDGALFMTVSVLNKANSDEPETTKKTTKKTLRKPLGHY